MIALSYIENNIKMLDYRYNKANSYKDKLFYSKLAMLELCGWIEESMDDIIQRCANRILRNRSLNQKVKKNIIEPNSGFQYKNNFIKMLTSLIGYINVIKLERILDGYRKDRLLSALNSLKTIRNSHAHTHLKGVTRQVDAPHIAMTYFKNVYPGLQDIENKLKIMFP